MTRFMRYALLIAGLTATGCGQSNSTGVAMLRPANPATDSAPHLSSSPQKSVPGDDGLGDDKLFVEQVLDGSQVDPLADPAAKAVVLIFVCTDCPIANRYAPELNRLHAKYQPNGVSFWLVYADGEESPEKIRKHLLEYQHSIPALRDPEHRLVRFCQARRTPEAAVLTPDRQQRYRGRIDDRFVGYGKSREMASQHDLEEAIEATLSGTAVPNPITDAIGCHIPGVDE